MSTEEIHDLVGAYAIGALGEPEAQAFEAHLAQCSACREELSSYDSTLESLAEPGEAEAAGGIDLEVLSSRIASEVAKTPQVSQTPETVTAPQAVPAAHSARQRSQAGVDDVTSPVTRATRPRFPRLLAAAAAVLVVALGGIGIAFALGSGTTSELADDVDRIRLAGDAIELPLGLGDATVYLSEAVGGVAVTGDVPSLAADEIYQVWIVPADGSAPVPGPVMAIAPDGALYGSWLTDLDGAAAIAVSIEPSGGSTTPTEVVAAVELET